MKTISMERVRELDKIWERERSAFLQMGQYYPGQDPHFIRAKYLDAIDLRKMSKKWGASIEELKAYVALQRYVNSYANNDLDGLPFSEDIAGSLGIPLSEFMDYLRQQVKEIHDSRASDDDDDIGDWREATAEDFDLDEDILQDAAREDW